MVIPVLVVQRQLGSVDLAYQHCAGELMLRTHSVIRADPFSFTAHGRPWLDQQCGSQLVLYLRYRALGWVGLAALHAALVALTMSFAYLAARAAGAPMRWAAWLSLAWFAVPELPAPTPALRRGSVRDMPVDRVGATGTPAETVDDTRDRRCLGEPPRPDRS